MFTFLKAPCLLNGSLKPSQNGISIATELQSTNGIPITVPQLQLKQLNIHPSLYEVVGVPNSPILRLSHHLPTALFRGESAINCKFMSLTPVDPVFLAITHLYKHTRLTQHQIPSCLVNFQWERVAKKVFPIPIVNEALAKGDKLANSISIQTNTTRPIAIEVQQAFHYEMDESKVFDILSAKLKRLFTTLASFDNWGSKKKDKPQQSQPPTQQQQNVALQMSSFLLTDASPYSEPLIMTDNSYILLSRQIPAPIIDRFILIRKIRTNLTVRKLEPNQSRIIQSSTKLTITAQSSSKAKSQKKEGKTSNTPKSQHLIDTFFTKSNQSKADKSQ